MEHFDPTRILSEFPGSKDATGPSHSPQYSAKRVDRLDGGAPDRTGLHPGKKKLLGLVNLLTTWPSSFTPSLNPLTRFKACSFISNSSDSVNWGDPDRRVGKNPTRIRERSVVQVRVFPDCPDASHSGIMHPQKVDGWCFILGWAGGRSPRLIDV